MNMKDLTGQKFNRWLVKNHVPNKGWLCLCDCGKERIVNGTNLRKSISKSCGCFQIEAARRRRLKHGHTSGGNWSSEYRIWTLMKDRCFNPRSHAFHNYGGRGITVCLEWKTNFESFFDHIGPRPSTNYTLDRINNDGNYEPGNVRWATRSQQAFNRRPKKYLRDQQKHHLPSNIPLECRIRETLT